MNDPSFDRRAVPDGACLRAVPLSDGWSLRWFDWPVVAGTKVKGSILFQCGRADMVEKYLETFAQWHASGWHVASFEWRGQAGSGRLAADPRVGHISDFAIWVDDLAECWQRWTSATPGPHFIMGHSMGGHLVLRAMIERRINPAGAVLAAPMLGFNAGIVPLRLIAPLVRFLAWLFPERRAWAEVERPTLVSAKRKSFLTHDDARYADELWWKSAKPELAIGSPSLSWVAQAYASNLAIAAPGRVERISIPLLLIGTQGDRLVSPAAIERVAARLPRAKLKMFDHTVAHEILREVDLVRNEALSLIDRFLDENGVA